MRSFARLLITLTVQGLSFKAIEETIKHHRNDHVTALQLKLDCILSQHVSIKDDESVNYIYMPYPSNDLVYNCFLKNFAENKQIYFQAMAHLSTVNHITIDHTFKVAANVGYLRPDGRWVAQYNSLFIVLNNIGQVIAWQLTTSTSIDECTELLSALAERLRGTQLNEVYVDNCCSIRQKLQSILGKDIRVCLDLFHAAQRVTRAIKKRYPLCRQVMKDVRLLFRNCNDKGRQRSLPTPDKDTLLKNIDLFLIKWKDADMNGQKILTDQVLKQISSLKCHIQQGCLSNIGIGCGTNRNENLHRSINPFFSRCRMGIPLAMALLTILFHKHNLKMSNGQAIFSARAQCKRSSDESTTYFGIMKKTMDINIDNWIFGSHLKNMPSISIDDVAEFDIDPDLEEIVTPNDVFMLLHTSSNLVKIAQNMQQQTKSSAMLNQKMIPFMSSVSCLFESVNASADIEEHKKRLLDTMHSWGFQLHPIEGDGNCCFSALAASIIFQHEDIVSQDPTFFTGHRIDVDSSVLDNIAYRLRQIAVEEWCSVPKRIPEFCR